MVPTSEKSPEKSSGKSSEEISAMSTAPEPTSSDPSPDELQEPTRKTWIRPDFEAVDTALEVTAYSARS